MTGYYKKGTIIIENKQKRILIEMNWKRTLFPAVLGCMLLSGCMEQREQAQQMLENQKDPLRHEATTFAMDTMMTFTIYHDDGEELLIDAEQEIRRLENMLSVTMEESDIMRLNGSAGQEKTEILKDTKTLLQMGKELYTETDGCFNIAISPIVKAWGFTEAEHHVPTQAELDALLPLTDPADIIIEEDTAYLAKEGMAVDLGGIAKGYASDTVAALLRQKGVDSAVFTLGGNVCAIGTKPNGEQWRTAVANPLDASDYVGLLSVTDACVVTSGGYQRYFEQDGKKYHHIIDPDTGLPAESGLLSVTIVSENGAKADALSTALFVMGLEEAEAYWKANTDFEVIFVTEDGQVIATEGLEDSFAFEGQDNDFVYTVMKR